MSDFEPEYPYLGFSLIDVFEKFQDEEVKPKTVRLPAHVNIGPNVIRKLPGYVELSYEKADQLYLRTLDDTPMSKEEWLECRDLAATLKIA